MSKGKNNNKNKGSKMPVKVQQMKKQKPIINKKDLKAAPVAIPKVVAKTAAKAVVKKENENKNLKVKNIEKKLDIVESGDDDDVDSEDIDFDSDIDDVDLEDSDDNIQGDSDDSDDCLEGESDDDVDDNASELDNSDYESMEMDENKLNESAEDSEEEVAPKKIETKEKKVKEQVPKKEENKLVKETIKNDKESKTDLKELITISKADEKILAEVNIRKNLINNAVVFVNKLHSSITREKMNALLKPIVPVQVNIPQKKKSKAIINRGYGFIRLANEADAAKVIEILNDKDINGMKIIANKFVCKKVYSEMSKVNLSRIVVHSFKIEDITAELKTHFKVPVNKHMMTQYEMTFSNEADASNLFNKKTMKLNGRELLFNYLYSLKPRVEVSAIEKVQEEEKTEILKTEVKPVKAGMKRSNCDSDDQVQEEQVVKKSKLNNGTQVITKVEKSKEEPKKVVQAIKKPVEKIPQIKETVNKKENNKTAQINKPANKASGDKKTNVKAQGNKGATMQHPLKKADKSPGKNKPFNKNGNKKPFNKK